MDAELIKWLGAVALLLVGALLKFAFDQMMTRMGWSREDRRAQEGKIERVDSHARTEVARIEREFVSRLIEAERDVAVLKERVASLPTADDMEELNRRLSAVDRGLSGVVSRVEGMNTNVKTILEHILAQERRG